MSLFFLDDVDCSPFFFSFVVVRRRHRRRESERGHGKKQHASAQVASSARPFCVPPLWSGRARSRGRVRCILGEPERAEGSRVAITSTAQEIECHFVFFFFPSLGEERHTSGREREFCSKQKKRPNSQQPTQKKQRQKQPQRHLPRRLARAHGPLGPARLGPGENFKRERERKGKKRRVKKEKKKPSPLTLSRPRPLFKKKNNKKKPLSSATPTSLSSSGSTTTSPAATRPSKATPSSPSSSGSARSTPRTRRLAPTTLSPRLSSRTGCSRCAS